MSDYLMDIAKKAIGRVADHPAVEPRIMPVFPPDDGSALLSMQFLSVLPGAGPAPAHWSVRPADSPQDTEQPPEASDDRPERTEKREEHRELHAASNGAEPVTRTQEPRPKAHVVAGKDMSPAVEAEDVMRAEERAAPDRPENRDDSQNMKAQERESTVRQQDYIEDSPTATVRPVPEPTPAPRVRRPAPTHEENDVESRGVAETRVHVAELQAAESNDAQVSPRQTVIRPPEPDRRPPRIPRLSGREKPESPEARDVNVRIGTVEVRAETQDRPAPPKPRPGPAGFRDYTAMRCYVPGTEERSRP